MTKEELITKAADDAGITKTAVGQVFNSMIGNMVKTLKKGQRVWVPGFGTFVVRKRAARTGRNPKTGATLKIKASKGVKFTAASALKKAVN